MLLAGDFNISALDYKQNKKVQNFVTTMKRPSNYLNKDAKKLTGKSLKKCEDPNEAYYLNIMIILF